MEISEKSIWNKWVAAYQEAFQPERQEILHCASFFETLDIKCDRSEKGKTFGATSF